ncbi:FadR/GntR family transcriptional regulator [Pseudomonas schmalbachii]|uniref:FadR family transcriptional regulator n=1 Tax=Pseudomonas schmalbachii TaxID=2816993 RepID=A0ABS3TN75_9PSED|nr:FadR/GntR family transcriptional regulator [Pseudomonas schmalbachii]MBO3274019.1 FadR family transcriptional regulator [Pseudomonas schmalbachii]
MTAAQKTPKPATEQSRQLVTEAIVEWLHRQIESEELKPGDKLPSESALQERFSVGRSAVREALSQLKSEGLVRAEQGRGVFVNERGARQVFRLQPASLDDSESLTHILELLVTFESAAARYAALRRTPEDLKRIKRALVGMEYAILNDELGEEEDFAFHQAIVEATRNPHFVSLNDYLEQHARRLIRQARTNTAQNYAELIQDVQDEHKAVFNAIEAGDAKAAAEAAETHLRNAAKRLNMYLQG